MYNRLGFKVFTSNRKKFFGPKVKSLIAALPLLGLMACASVPLNDADPREDQNRAVHRANVGLDRVVLRPVSQAYGTVVPSPIRTGVRNFASNLALPAKVLNNLLQFRIEDAGTNAMRFALNSTIGLGGVLDVAGQDIPEQSTDFGETLYVWGVPEGTYTELPLLGPSTSRHVAGRLVDFVINPVNAITATPESGILTGSRITAGIGARYEFTDLIDSVLYESADSYAQSRLLYLQNRRFKLSGEAQAEEFDPYDDIYETN